jgi:membrane fusion protein (multidrug efflux system)
MTTPVQDAPQARRNHTKTMWMAITIFLLLGCAWFFYWFFYGRFYEKTDDAYVNGNIVVLTPQIPGIITSISAIETDFVSQGRVIIQLDPTDPTIEYDRSQAELANTVRQVVQMYEMVKEYEAKIEVQKAQLIKESQDYAHRKELIDEGGVSLENFEHAQARLSSSFFSLVMIEYQYLEALAAVENTSLLNHPLIVQAKDKVRASFVRLQRCTIASPVTGVVSLRKAQVGERVEPGTPLLSIVPLEQMWVNANFKEVQLSKMRIGQSAMVSADIYGGSVVYHGKVVGFLGGTGSVFSLLPPQNATGNWIKIVQRLPVKIALDPEELKRHPLRLGLSMEVSVDLHDEAGSVVPQEKPPEPIYETTVFEKEEEGVDAVINKIITDNIPPSFIQETERPLLKEES